MKTKLLCNMLIFCLLFMISSYVISQDFEIPDGPYLGQKPPGLKPEVFAPGIISLPDRFEYCLSFSPNGKECCFGVTNGRWSWCDLFYTKQDIDGIWSQPDSAYFQNGNDGWLPHFTHDDHFL